MKSNIEKFYIKHGFHSFRLGKFKVMNEQLDLDVEFDRKHPYHTQKHVDMTSAYFDHNDKVIHSKAIQYYTADSSSLNSRLWKGEADFDLNAIRGLDSVTSKPIHRNITVFSGLSHGNLAKSLLKTKDNILHLPAYTSTSIMLPVAHAFCSPKQSLPHHTYFVKNNYNYNGPSEEDDELKKHFHGDILAFNLKKNVHRGSYINTHSLHTTEKEFLLPRDIHVKISKHPTHTETYNNGNATFHRHIWEADILSPEYMEKYK